MRIFHLKIIFWPFPAVFGLMTALALPSIGQSPAAASRSAPTAAEFEANFGTDSGSQAVPAPYVQPSEKVKFDSYLWEAYGPYPIASAAFVSGFHQATRNPPEWREGFPGYGERLASDFGISAIDETTRYAVAEATGEDVFYYRCHCPGVWPKLKHAVVESVVARRGADGHKVFNLPALVAPYAGPMVAVYAWYPSRYSAKDAFRMGNYGMLAYLGDEISLEFVPLLVHSAKGHSWVSRLHLENRHAAAE